MIRGPFRPRVDIPEFSRCCFCLPLRYGLLVWGYFKMGVLSILAYLLIEDTIRLSARSSYNVPAILVLFLCLVLIDIIFNIMFIVAGHMKHQQIFKMYYYYSLVFLATFVIGYIVVLGSHFYSFRGLPAYLYMWLILETLYIAVPVILIQIYVTLLVRSEARKLGNNSNFQFVNTVSDPGYVMNLNNVENAVES